MRSSTKWLAAASVAGIAVAATAVAIRLQHTREQQRWAMLKTYCTECHNKDDLAGEISFQGLTPESVPQHPEIFEAAVRKLRGRLMPPPGSPQPSTHDVDSLIAWLERAIDKSEKD